MGIKSKAISDTLYEQAQASLKKVGRSSKAGHRLQAIISAKRYGITAVARIYDITRATLMSWIRRFEEAWHKSWAFNDSPSYEKAFIFLHYAKALPL